MAERLPGVDGLIGTADDVPAPGKNLNGTATYAHFVDLAPQAGSNFWAFISGTFEIQELLVLSGATVSVDEFAVSLSNLQSNGITTTSRDLSDPPHELAYEFPGSLTARYTLRTCIGVSTTACLITDLTLSGFTLIPGVDPHLLPGISPELASYLNYLVTLAPAAWTALSITVSPSTEMETSNTRGLLAPYFVGGSTSGVTVLVSTDPIEVVPEASTEVGGAAAIFALLWLARPPNKALHPTRPSGAPTVACCRLAS